MKLLRRRECIVLSSIDHVSLVQLLVAVEIGLGVVSSSLCASQIRFGLSQAGLRYVLLRFRFGEGTRQVKG
jgi:hypothetical protein